MKRFFEENASNRAAAVASRCSAKAGVTAHSLGDNLPAMPAIPTRLLTTVRSGNTLSSEGTYRGIMHGDGNPLCQPMNGFAPTAKLPLAMPTCPGCGKEVVFEFAANAAPPDST
jgi:hypothetical protein